MPTLQYVEKNVIFSRGKLTILNWGLKSTRTREGFIVDRDLEDLYSSSRHRSRELLIIVEVKREVRLRYIRA